MGKSCVVCSGKFVGVGIFRGELRMKYFGGKFCSVGGEGGLVEWSFRAG